MVVCRLYAQLDQHAEAGPLDSRHQLRRVHYTGRLATLSASPTPQIGDSYTVRVFDAGETNWPGDCLLLFVSCNQGVKTALLICRKTRLLGSIWSQVRLLR